MHSKGIQRYETGLLKRVITKSEFRVRRREISNAGLYLRHRGKNYGQNEEKVSRRVVVREFLIIRIIIKFRGYDSRDENF